MNLAQRMAQSMLFRPPSKVGGFGRITEAGVWPWVWTVAPKVLSWVGQLGVVVGLSEVASYISEDSDTQAQAETTVSPAGRQYWSDKIDNWRKYANLFVDPGYSVFITPVYHRALQMADEPLITRAQIVSLAKTFGKYVRAASVEHPTSNPPPGYYLTGSNPETDWWYPTDETIAASAAVTDPAAVDESYDIVSGATIIMDPVTGQPVPVRQKAKPNWLALATVALGAYSTWRAFRG